MNFAKTAVAVISNPSNISTDGIFSLDGGAGTTVMMSGGRQAIGNVGLVGAMALVLSVVSSA